MTNPTDFIRERDAAAESYFATLKHFHGHITTDLLVAYEGGYNACLTSSLVKEMAEALRELPHDPLCAIIGGYGHCNCVKQALERYNAVVKELENG